MAAYLPEDVYAVPDIFGRIAWLAPVEGPSQCRIELRGEGGGTDMHTPMWLESDRVNFDGDCYVQGRLFVPSLPSMNAASNILTYDPSSGEIGIMPSGTGSTGGANYAEGDFDMGDYFITNVSGLEQDNVRVVMNGTFKTINLETRADASSPWTQRLMTDPNGVVVSNDLDVVGNVTLNQNVNVNGKLFVTEISALGGTTVESLYASGIVNVDGPTSLQQLSVNQTAHFHDTVYVENTTTLNSTLFLPSLTYVPSAGTMLTLDTTTGEVMWTAITGANQTVDTAEYFTVTEDLMLPNVRTFRTSYGLFVEPMTGIVYKAETPYQVTFASDGSGKLNVEFPGVIGTEEWVEIGSETNRWRLKPDDVGGTLLTQKWENGEWVTTTTSGGGGSTTAPESLTVANEVDSWRIIPTENQTLAVQLLQEGVWVTKSEIGTSA